MVSLCIIATAVLVLSLIETVNAESFRTFGESSAEQHCSFSDMNSFCEMCRSGDNINALSFISKWRGASDVFNVKVCDGSSALHVAASMGRESIVQALIDVPGIEVNARDESGSSPLILAIMNHHIEHGARIASGGSNRCECQR